MAKSRFGTPAERPLWPTTQNPIGAPLLNTSSPILDAVGEKYINAGYVIWSDGGTHDLRSIRWRCGNGFTGTVQLSARDVELTAGPPLRDDGVVDQSVSRVNPATNTNYTDTFSADRVGVDRGVPPVGARTLAKRPRRRFGIDERIPVLRIPGD